MKKCICGIIGIIIPFLIYYFCGGSFERDMQLGATIFCSICAFFFGMFFYDLNEEANELKNKKNN